MALEPTPTTQTNQSAIASGDQELLSWSSDEYVHYQRDRRWYLIVGVGAVVAVILLILGQRFLLNTGGGTSIIPAWLEYGLMALVFSLTAFVVLRHADDKPRHRQYAITPLGVTIDEQLYPYNELRLYWLLYKPPISTLNVQQTNRFAPILKMRLGDVDPLAVRNVLRQFLPEEAKAKEDFMDRFSRFIRL